MNLITNLNYHKMTRTKDIIPEQDPFVTIQQEPTFLDMPVRDIVPSKGDITQMAWNVLRSIQEGKVEPIEAAIRLNAIKKLCEEAIDLIRPDVISAMDSGRVSSTGAKIEKMEAGTKYDYSANPMWETLNKEVESSKAALKSLEDTLKKIPAGKELVDTDTGEVLIGPSKTSTTTFKVTLAK